LAVLAERLYAAYGPQGWWPLLEHRGSNPTLTGRLTGYHPGDYSFPRTEAQRFEICCGAILTRTPPGPTSKSPAGACPSRLAGTARDGVGRRSTPAAGHSPLGYFRPRPANCAPSASLTCDFPAARRRVKTSCRCGAWGPKPRTASALRLRADRNGGRCLYVRVLRHHGYQRPRIELPPHQGLLPTKSATLASRLSGVSRAHVEHAKRLRAAASGSLSPVEWTGGRCVDSCRRRG